jgi:sugar lactone lactonase YvrE
VAVDFATARVVPVNGTGPEDVVVDADGRVYTGFDDGRIVRVSHGGDRIETVARVPGRPLGLEFRGPDELVVCASDAGLLAVRLDRRREGSVRVLVSAVAGRRLLAVNNAAVAPDGAVYFSDSSTRHRIPQWRADLIERTSSGRLFRLDPDGGVCQLLDGLDFANGVALATDGSFVAVAETGSRRLRRVHLTGDRAGSDDVLVDGLPGYPDNIATGSDGLIWIAIPAPRVAALDRVQRLPDRVRPLIGRLPERLLPGPAATVAVVAVDAAGDTAGNIALSCRGVLDGFTMLTGVREAGGTLWFGSVQGRALATMPRPGGRASRDGHLGPVSAG